MRRTLFSQGNLAQPYHSINTDVNKRIRYLEPAVGQTDAEVGTPTDHLAQHSHGLTAQASIQDKR